THLVAIVQGGVILVSAAAALGQGIDAEQATIRGHRAVYGQFAGIGDGDRLRQASRPAVGVVVVVGQVALAAQRYPAKQAVDGSLFLRRRRERNIGGIVDRYITAGAGRAFVHAGASDRCRRHYPQLVIVVVQGQPRAGILAERAAVGGDGNWRPAVAILLATFVLARIALAHGIGVAIISRGNVLRGAALAPVVGLRAAGQAHCAGSQRGHDRQPQCALAREPGRYTAS